MKSLFLIEKLQAQPEWVFTIKDADDDIYNLKDAHVTYLISKYQN